MLHGLPPWRMPLANYLKMLKRQEVLALLALKWSFRRIERETGVRRETVSAYARGTDSNPAKTFPGSGGLGLSFRGFGGRGWSKPGQNVPRLRVKSGQNVPRLPVAAEVCGGRPPRHDHGEAGCRPDHPANLPGPGRGLLLRVQLRVGEAVRADAGAQAASVWRDAQPTW
jgi:hypothetical protein